MAIIKATTIDLLNEVETPSDDDKILISSSGMAKQVSVGNLRTTFGSNSSGSSGSDLSQQTTVVNGNNGIDYIEGNLYAKDGVLNCQIDTAAQHQYTEEYTATQADECVSFSLNTYFPSNLVGHFAYVKLEAKTAASTNWFPIYVNSIGTQNSIGTHIFTKTLRLEPGVKIRGHIDCQGATNVIDNNSVFALYYNTLSKSRISEYNKTTTSFVMPIPGTTAVTNILDVDFKVYSGFGRSDVISFVPVISYVNNNATTEVYCNYTLDLSVTLPAVNSASQVAVLYRVASSPSGLSDQPWFLLTPSCSVIAGAQRTIKLGKYSFGSDDYVELCLFNYGAKLQINTTKLTVTQTYAYTNDGNNIVADDSVAYNKDKLRALLESTEPAITNNMLVQECLSSATAHLAYQSISYSGADGFICIEETHQKLAQSGTAVKYIVGNLPVVDSNTNSESFYFNDGNVARTLKAYNVKSLDYTNNGLATAANTQICKTYNAQYKVTNKALDVSIKLPTCLENLATGAFNGATGLSSIEFGKPYNDSNDNKVYTRVEIPPSCFNNCTNLKTVKLTNGITTIGANAFLGCTALTEFYFPSTINSLISTAFGTTKVLNTNANAHTYIVVDVDDYNSKVIESARINKNTGSFINAATTGYLQGYFSESGLADIFNVGKAYLPAVIYLVDENYQQLTSSDGKPLIFKPENGAVNAVTQ